MRVLRDVEISRKGNAYTLLYEGGEEEETCTYDEVIVSFTSP